MAVRTPVVPRAWDQFPSGPFRRCETSSLEGIETATWGSFVGAASLIASEDSLVATLSSLDRRLADLESQVKRLLVEARRLNKQTVERPLVYNAQLVDLGEACPLGRPLQVVLESYPDRVIARLPEFDLYACGASDSLAIVGLKKEIRSTYLRLRDLGPEKLGPMAATWFSTMKSTIGQCDGKADR